MTTKTRISYANLERQVDELVSRHRAADYSSVHGVPRGGLVPAAMVAARLGLPLTDTPWPEALVVDDLIDSGATLRRLADRGRTVDALYRKERSPNDLAPRATIVPDSDWLVFPWEVGTADEAGPEDAIVRLLTFIGEDPNRPGLKDTPGRVLRSFKELTAGYDDDAALHLERTFPDHADEMVAVAGIDFTSLCEHHLLTFTGTVDLAYIPRADVVGLSKLARVVDVYARRLQVQERMTEQIADAITDALDPLGVGVVVRAKHSCMGCRGVRKPGAVMVTSALRGYMKERPAARAEFLALVGPVRGV